MSASASKKKRKELEEQGLSAKDVAAKKAKEKKNKTLRNVLITALAVALCLAAVFAVIKLVNRPSYDTKAAVVTVGDEKVTVPVYNIFYSNTAYNLISDTSTYLYLFVQSDKPLSEQTYGDGTMEDYFKSEVNSSLQSVLNVVAKAKADGYKLTSEDKKQIKSTLDSVKEESESYGWPNVNQYLKARYGEGADLDAYEDYLELVVTASSYYNKLQEDFQPTAEELKTAYDADPSAFDLVSFTYAISNAESTTVEAEDSGEAGDGENEDGDTTADTGSTEPTTTTYTDEAIAAAKELAAGYKTEMPEDASTSTYTKTYAEYYFNDEIVAWLFDAARKEGDAEVFARNDNETSFYTVRFDGRETNDYGLADANILAIAKDAADAELAEGQQTAEEKRDALLAAVQAGMTDEAFTEAAAALGYSVDVNGIDRYNSATEVVDFLYDSARKNGDLLTTYEDDNYYYVIRFVSTHEDSYRDEQVRESLFAEFYKGIASASELTVVEDMMQYANTDLTFSSGSSDTAEG